MNIAQTIDHTCLKATMTRQDARKLCEEAMQHHFKAVCLPSCWLSYAQELLKESAVLKCTVIGFPLGHSSTEAKIAEAQSALDLGADEIDMVINIGLFKGGSADSVLAEIKAIKNILGDITLKVIVETALLDAQEIAHITKIVVQSGANFIKTSTGFSTRGASLEDIQIMHKHAQGKIQIKASGGIKNREQAEAYIKAGANRLGTSSGVAIAEE